MEKLVKVVRANRKKPANMRIIQCFVDADLRGSHKNLQKTALAYKLDLAELQENEAVIFINKKRTLMKCAVKGNTFSFTRRDHIDLEVVEYLPRYFGGDGFDYDGALEESLNTRLKKRGVSERVGHESSRERATTTGVGR